MMKITVIKNKGAGKGKLFSGDTDLQMLMEKYGIDADIIEIPGSGIQEVINSAIENGTEIIAVSGGDGTLNSAVQALMGKDVPMAVIPAGTLNHFAKDAGIPVNSEDAVKIIPEMYIKKVDVAEVNGRYFLNNSSVGIYPKVVKHRDREIKETGTGKWVAMGRAIIAIFKRLPLIEVKIKSDITKIYCKTPIVFIGNNEYKTDLFNAGIREKLTEGKLSLFYPTWAGRFTLLRFAVLGLLGRLKDQKDFHTISTEEIKIESPKSELEVAVDGEVLHLQTPLFYKIHPLSLKVIVPRENS